MPFCLQDHGGPEKQRAALDQRGPFVLKTLVADDKTDFAAGFTASGVLAFAQPANYLRVLPPQQFA